MTIEEFMKYATDDHFTNIQINELTSNQVEASYIDDKLENNDASYTITYSIKAEKNGKTVKISTDYLEKSIIDFLNRKVENEDSKYEDDYLEDTTNNNSIDVNKVEIQEQLDMLKDVYKKKEKYTNIKSITSEFYGRSKKERIVNSNGVDMSTTNEVYGFYCEVIVEEDGKIISHDKSALKTNKNDIDVNKLADAAIEEAEIMINKKELSTGKFDIVLSNEVAGSVIANMMSGIYANNIREKISIYVDKKDKKIANNKITIMEDPKNKDYPGNELFDNDGIQTTKKCIVKDGVLQTYLYNIKEAKLAGVESTGNSFSGIGTRNMYVAPGELSEEEIFKKMKNGLYITGYMGSSSTAINISTGSISLQIFGFIIEDGEKKCGFEPCVMTTTFDELLNNVEEVGNNLEFFSNASASPALYIKNISVAGK
ncbi:MAG: TldD/PmbA family protein [Bacilli bacterium]|nr:TldD/PmbA family protein [Bacilli bacterium]